MTKSVVLLAVMSLLCGSLVLGCGGGEGSPPPAPETESGYGGGGAQRDAAVKQAVENCKRSVEQQPTASPEVKSDLVEICEKAAKGDEKEVREATQEVCEKLIEENVPAGPAREQALRSCERGTQGG